MLWRRDGRLDAALGGAALAQVQLVHRVVLDRREMHDGIALAGNCRTTSGNNLAHVRIRQRPSSSNSVRSARAASERLCVAITIAISRSRDSSTNRSCSRSLFA